MELSLTIVGSVVKTLREQLEWNADKLAEKANVSVQTISELETGKRNIRIKTLHKLCTALSTNPNVILGYEVYSPKSHVARQLDDFDEIELELVQNILRLVERTRQKNKEPRFND